MNRQPFQRRLTHLIVGLFRRATLVDILGKAMFTQILGLFFTGIVGRKRNRVGSQRQLAIPYVRVASGGQNLYHASPPLPKQIAVGGIPG